MIVIIIGLSDKMFVLENHANHAVSERNGLSRQTTVDNKVVIS